MSVWISSKDRLPTARDGFIIVHWPHVMEPGSSGIKFSTSPYDTREKKDYEHVTTHSCSFLWTPIPREASDDREPTDLMVELEYEREQIARLVSGLFACSDKVSLERMDDRNRHNHCLEQLRERLKDYL